MQQLASEKEQAHHRAGCHRALRRRMRGIILLASFWRVQAKCLLAALVLEIDTIPKPDGLEKKTAPAITNRTVTIPNIVRQLIEWPSVAFEIRIPTFASPILFLGTKEWTGHAYRCSLVFSLGQRKVQQTSSSRECRLTELSHSNWEDTQKVAARHRDFSDRSPSAYPTMKMVSQMRTR